MTETFLGCVQPGQLERLKQNQMLKVPETTMNQKPMDSKPVTQSSVAPWLKGGQRSVSSSTVYAK